jgi:large subunit ribosomal protein L30
MVKITLVKSVSNENKSVKATVAALGLKKIRSTKTLEATPANLGQINKVAYLLKVEEV